MRSYLRQPVIASPVIQQPENLSSLMQQLAEKPLLRSLIPHILYVHTPARTPTPIHLYVCTPMCLHLAPSPPHPPQDASTHVLNEGAVVLHDEGAVLLGHNVKVHQHTLPLSPHSTPLHLLLCDKKQGIGCSTDTHLYTFTYAVSPPSTSTFTPPLLLCPSPHLCCHHPPRWLVSHAVDLASDASANLLQFNHVRQIKGDSRLQVTRKNNGA